MRRVLAALVVVPLLLLGSTTADYARAKRKLELIESGRLAPKTSISLSAREINAYAQGELASMALDGVRNPKVELGVGMATGSALVDFAKLRQSRGASTNWLLKNLLEGERPVVVTVKLQSGGGRAKVDVERVEVSGVSLSGSALDFLINNFLLPLYPDAKIGVPFELADRVERIDVRPDGVRVEIGD
jgi:hypothetical protein